MLEQLMTRRKLILLASVSSFLSGCSMFSSDRYSYQPVSYDNSEGSKVLRTAMSQYGAKYKYGKASPSDGFDCSGLIFWAYGKHGITVPRHTAAQSKAGKWVAARNARQGDIVVFRIGRRLHTGLVADKGRFLHAPSSGGMSEWKVSPVSTGKTRSSDTAESCKANDIILKNHIVT